jgi:hypothetical protein
MKNSLVPTRSWQGHAADKFFYFFMGLRKGEIQRRVTRLMAEFPDETPEMLARRLIRAQIPLSLLGGAVLHLPLFVPGVGPVLKMLGMAGGATVIMQMHLYLILEIALLFGHDIDDRDRLKEMAAVVAASGLASGSTFISEALALKPYLAVLGGGLAVTAVSQLIGEAAIRYYGDSANAPALAATDSGGA